MEAAWLSGNSDEQSGIIIATEDVFDYEVFSNGLIADVYDFFGRGVVGPHSSTPSGVGIHGRDFWPEKDTYVDVIEVHGKTCPCRLSLALFRL